MSCDIWALSHIPLKPQQQSTLIAREDIAWPWAGTNRSSYIQLRVLSLVRHLVAMASQLLPLGKPIPSSPPLAALAHPGYITELIDKCVGSRIWVIMKGEKGAWRQKEPPGAAVLMAGATE